MACDIDSLKALEGLMSEFFNDSTTNERKREIETILSNFGQQQGAWKQCLYYLSHTHNYYVSMFCLTTLENIINKRWTGLSGDDRVEIRSTLYRFVLENQKIAPNYIRNKLVKLVVDIARLSWPNFYPDFFTNILSLIRSPDTVVLCLVFLQTISEELIFSREELSYTRKVELKRLLTQQIPSVLAVIGGCLDGIIDKHKNGATATPPPSPTHGNHSPSPSRVGFGTDVISPFHSSSLVSTMFQSLAANHEKHHSPLPPFDSESETIAALALNCLTHLFTWIPLSSLVTPRLLNTIFIYAALGVDVRQNESPLNIGQNLDSSLLSNSSLSVLAMSSINEILSKNCVPVDLENFLLQTFRHTFHLLQRLVNAEKCHLDKLDPTYLDKFSEFLRLFVSLHLRRFENNSQFPVLDFLSLLFRYTFLQPNMDAYFSCLEVWSFFLDHLTTKLGTADQNSLTRYEDALLTLARGILFKVQLRHNQTELEELDHDLPDEPPGEEDADSLFGESIPLESEWQGFLSHNLEIFAKVADLFPDQVFKMVYEPFLDASKIYLSLQSSITHHSVPGAHRSLRRKLNITAEHECKRLHCLLRDLSSLMQGVGRLSILFLGENLSKRSETALQVIDKLIEMANYSTGIKFFEVEVSVSVLQQDFIEVHAQILSTLRAWTHWLSQLYGQQFVQVFPGGTQTHQYLDTCHTINKQMLVSGANVLTCGAPPLIVHCGVNLLSSLSVLVRSPVALELTQIQSLYTQATAVDSELKSHHSLCRALVSFLLLPWPSFVVSHKMDLRRQHLHSFIESLTKEFSQIDIQSLRDDNAAQEANIPIIIETLSMTRAQIDELNGTDKASRETYYNCIRDVLQHAIQMFPIYVQHADVCEEILSLVVMSTQVLRIQMGPVQVGSTVQTLMDVFNSNQHLYLAVSENKANSITVVEKFLKLLELISSDPSSSYRRFIPSTLTLCLNHIYPVVAERSSPEIKGPLFRLFQTLLEHNWKFFFKSTIHSTLGSSQCDMIENGAQFNQLMECFGQSFMQADIGIFKQNLETLENLNLKYKLYNKPAVRTSMLGQFITVLLQILIHKSHDILQEEVSLAIYNMACVDFDAFFASFIPHFLQRMDGLTDQQRVSLRDHFKSEMDLPSFMQNVQRFVNDLRFYRMCNASLPADSVKF